ncbi:transglutaminase family protein [Paenibacillus solisilvae]|uniref:Transglutaminase family protein n=1 Tax=Paenibacillus solisilvae TaxID=2486751 RepID=A0ABW0VYK3_9BACL
MPEGTAINGQNEVIVQSANYSYSHWIVGIDNGNFSGASFKSYDQGATWSSERMGYDYSLRGEYVIRWFVESNEIQSDEPVRWALQSLDHPDLKVFKVMENLDGITKGTDSDFEKAQRLCSWAAKQWVHTGGLIYPPFHLPTILDWKRKGRGHGFSDIRGFCVHFANLLMQACWASGMYARGVALPSYTDTGPEGHFVSEVYCRDLGKWVMFDPDFDTQVFDGGQPLNVGEIHRCWKNGTIDRLTMHQGPSFGTNPLGLDVLINHFKKGGYRHFAIYRMQDYLSRPDHQMVNHGAIDALAYHEPDMVWYDDTLELRKHFPHVSDDLELFYFDPTGEVRR